MKKLNKRLFNPSVWDDIPMKRDDCLDSSIIEPDFELHLSKKPKIPDKFRFNILNPKDENDVEKLTKFLNTNYLSKQFPISKFSKKYISFKLNTPIAHNTTNNFKHILCVETIENSDIIGVVVAVPCNYMIDEQTISGMHIDYLNTHKSFRGLNLTNVLLKELYRSLRLHKVEVGSFFFSEDVLPFQSITESTNLLKRDLIPNHSQENLEALRDQTTDTNKIKEFNEIIDKFSLTPTNAIEKIRLANKADMQNLLEIYKSRCKEKYRVFKILNQKEFEYLFLPKKNLIYTYVLTNSKGEVKDFVSFYVYGKNRKSLFLSYATFLVKDKLLELFLRNVLYVLKENGYNEVFVYDTLGMETTLQKLHFEKVNDISKGMYIFNYNTKKIKLEECGMMIDF